MSLFQRHRWFVAAAGITLVFTVVTQAALKGAGLTAFADLTGLALMLAALGVTVVNALTRPRLERGFWGLLALGFALWATNQLAWSYREIVTQQSIPHPFFYDIILFFHMVPMVAAVGWRPDLLKKEGKVLPGLLHFGMLFGWWIFLYAFIVFPYQYVLFDVRAYNVSYDRPYGVENALLPVVLGTAVWTSSGGW